MPNPISYLPQQVLSYICESIISPHSPTYLLVDENTKLIDYGGNLDYYGLDTLKIGDSIQESLVFLDGLLPLSESPLCLQFVTLQTGLTVDIHLFSRSEGTWILLLDVTINELEKRLVQQKRNDLSLIVENIRLREIKSRGFSQD